MTNQASEEQLDDILDTLAEKSADSDSRLGYVDAYVFAQEAKQALIDWHNKQIEEALDRLDSKAFYDVSGTSPLINPREIEAERNKLKERDDE